MLPHCKFLGFDPNGAYENLFKNILGGKYIKAGVESKKGGNIILQSKNYIIFLIAFDHCNAWSPVCFGGQGKKKLKSRKRYV